MSLSFLLFFSEHEHLEVLGQTLGHIFSSCMLASFT